MKKKEKINITKDDDYSLTAIQLNRSTNSIKILSKLNDGGDIEYNTIYINQKEARKLAIALLQLSMEE
tara:strand:- start:471 stop:674 length:204 start_codon:yes stop_codon:yes gene_type:complete